MHQECQNCKCPWKVYPVTVWLLHGTAVKPVFILDTDLKLVCVILKMS